MNFSRWESLREGGGIKIPFHGTWMNLKALLKVFEILGGIDTTFELCIKVAHGIKWIIHTIQNVVNRIHSAKKK